MTSAFDLPISLSFRPFHSIFSAAETVCGGRVVRCSLRLRSGSVVKQPCSGVMLATRNSPELTGHQGCAKRESVRVLANDSAQWHGPALSIYVLSVNELEYNKVSSFTHLASVH